MFKPEQLNPVVNAAMTDNPDFVNAYLSAVVKTLAARYTLYRSFGPYWWPLKELLIERGVTLFGDTVEGVTTPLYRLKSDALICASAQQYQAHRAVNQQLFDADHVLDSDGTGESTRYVLNDEIMEHKAILQVI
jgi:hypothetical protein